MEFVDIDEFVQFVVKACEERTPYKTRELRLAAKKIAGWADRGAGLPLDPDVLFRREIIANYIASGNTGYSPASAGNLRSQLFRMSETMRPDDVVRRVRPLPRSEPTHPYSRHDLAQLRMWAAHQSTKFRVTNAQVLLALGLGAGLSAIEIGHLTARDIEVTNDTVVANVNGSRPRRVPVLSSWDKALRDRKDELAPDKFVFRENHGQFYPTLITNFVDKSNLLGVRPHTQRMRTTWLVHHLSAGTPVNLLIRAAGMDSLEAFTRYLRFVPAVDDHEFESWMSLNLVIPHPTARRVL